MASAKRRIRIVKRCWPKGGGVLLNPGIEVELKQSAIALLPADAWVAVDPAAKAVTETPKDRQAKSVKTK